MKSVLMQWNKIGLIFCLVFIGFFMSAPAIAAKNLIKKMPPKVLKLEAIKVEGRLQKPQAFYILQRSQLDFENFEFKESFFQKTIQTLEDKAFD